MQPKQLSTDQQHAYTALGIPHTNRIILSLDGGGIRGILTIQLLKKMEDLAGIPLHRFCDMVAGTSTGAIIAGLIATGKTAVEIEELYVRFVTKVFLKRGLLSGRVINPPKYDKKNYRAILKRELANITLEGACKKTSLDLMITAKDVTDNEETFFTYFTNKQQPKKNTYKKALLRTVLEATMSAPTYFHPLERFVDGTTTTYNNPSMAAFMEATCYSGLHKYDPDHITLFSLGTGKLVRSVSPEEAYDPKALDAIFWMNYVMDTSSQDASSMQCDAFRCGLFKTDYRRFQVSLDPEAMKKLPDRPIGNEDIVDADWLHHLTAEDLSGIGLDDVGKFGLMKVIGEAMVEYIMKKNRFCKDLNNTPSKRDELVTAFGDIAQIEAQVSSAAWIDGIGS